MADKPANAPKPPDKKPGTALVTIPGSETVLCNVPVNSDEERMLIFNALAGACGKLDELINKEVRLKNAIICRHDWVNEETGELKPGHKVWLILDNGEVYFSGSDGLTKSLQLIRGFFGEPPWSPPVKVLIKQVPMGNQRFYHLQLVK